MLWARAAQVSQAALAAKRPDGRWARPAESLRSRMASSAGGVRSVVSVGFDYPMVNRTGFPGDSISWEIMESWED